MGRQNATSSPPWRKNGNRIDFQHLVPHSGFISVLRAVMRDFERGRPASRAFRITHNGHPAASIEIGTEERGRNLRHQSRVQRRLRWARGFECVPCYCLDRGSSLRQTLENAGKHRRRAKATRYGRSPAETQRGWLSHVSVSSPCCQDAKTPRESRAARNRRRRDDGLGWPGPRQEIPFCIERLHSKRRLRGMFGLSAPTRVRDRRANESPRSA